MSVTGIASYDATKRHYLNEFATGFIAKKVVKTGDVVLDLGANAGYHTRTLSDLVGENGKVHAFEPNPKLWPGLFSLPNVRLWPVAVGSLVTVETFVLPRDTSMNQVGSIVDPRDFMGDIDVDYLSVPQVTLDSLNEIAQSKVKFVKIDVERRELQCFIGAKRLLIVDKPVVVFENQTDAITRQLADCGYKIYDMIPGVQQANVVAVHENGAFSPDQVQLSEDEVSELVAAVEAAG